MRMEIQFTQNGWKKKKDLQREKKVKNKTLKNTNM